MKKTKLYLVSGFLALLVFYVVFQTLQGQSLMGLFSGGKVIERASDLSTLTYGLDSYTSAELVTMAEQAKTNAETYASTASSAATDAINAYTYYDADALETAQDSADSSASSAETKASSAEAIADELYSRYEFEARLESVDQLVDGINVQELLTGLQERYDTTQYEYGIIFEEYWHNFEVDIPDPTDEGGTDEWVYDWSEEMMGTIITETDFWTDYETTKEDYLDAYNELYGILDAAGSATDYLENMDAYETDRLEFENQIFDLGITNTVVENLAESYSANSATLELGTMLAENYGIANILESGSFADSEMLGLNADLLQGIQIQMGVYQSTFDSIRASTLNVESVDTLQLQNYLLNNYSRNVFFNNILSASELDKNVFLASGETADELYAYYELAYADALVARASATASALSATVANSYAIKTCASLSLTPSSYAMDWDDTEADFTLTATPNITTSTAAYSKWAGTLTFLTNGGYFTYGATTDYMIEIPLTDTTIGSFQVAYTKGSVDDLLKVFIAGEEATCSQSFMITQTSTPSVTITESSGSTALTEGGSTDTYTVALNSAPTSAVTVSVTSDAQATVSSNSLTFSTSNWNTAQTITVTAVDDSTVEGTHSAVITHTVSSSDINYTGLTVNKVTASVTDNDSASTGTTDTDGDGIDDATDTDDDGDGLSDYDEVYTYGTDPLLTDTDGDGLSDYEEVYVYDSDPLDKTSGNSGTCNSLTLSPSTLELDEDESSTISIEVDTDGTWDGDVYVVWSDNDAYITSDDGEVHESEFAGEGPLTTGTYYLLYTSGGNSGTEDETETLSVSLEGSSCTDTIEITVPATSALTSTEDCEEDYQDVEEDDWFAETVCRLTDAGFVEGRVQYSSYSLFYPDDEITKAEVLKLISLILLDLDESDAQGKTSGFTDPNLTTEWFYWAVINTEDEDVIRTRDAGTIGNFNSNITRGELAVYIARALGLTSYSFEIEYSDVDEDDWFAYAVALLSRTDDEYVKDMLYDGTDEELPVIEGYSDGTFEPYDEINRAEALTMIYRAYQIYIAE